MKISAVAILTSVFFFIFSQANAQAVDNLTINGIRLCGTTIASLKEQNNDIKEVDVVEMDLAKDCYGQDSRFTAGKGYAFEKYPGLIFQKDQNSDLISKIRITNIFTGELPDGRSIDMSKMLLKDLLNLYPQLKNKWGSRDCSDYWNFSNDTLSFFVKIDKSKKPQYPIDEAYYMDKPIEAVDFVISCYKAQPDNDNHLEVMNTDPVYIIDSVRVYKKDLMKIDPNTVAIVSVYKDTNAVNKFGNEAKNGLYYIETKQFARQRYWRYFKAKSNEYSKIVPSPDSDSDVQYILNKRVLKNNFEGDLATIDDSIFQSIQILNKDQLVKTYHITKKKYGVVIISKVPANLKNADKKF